MKTFKFALALLCLSLLVSACTTETSTAVLTSTVQTAVEPSPLPTQAPTQVPEPTEPSEPMITFDMNGLAQAVATLALPEVQPGADNPGAVAMPQQTLLWLYGYPITTHVREPQIFLFEIEDIAVNDAAVQAVQGLQAFLQSQQAVGALPFLPLTADVQQMHAQVKPLDFKSGKGVRFLTQYSNGMSPINNQMLFYTFQGLTNDGKYYTAAVLPVYLNGLPLNPTDTSNLPLEFTSDFNTYVANLVNPLDLQSASDYAPDLDLLDALVQSIVVE